MRSALVDSATRVNLCFHGIGTPEREREPGESAYWVGSDVFHRILDEVADEPRVRLSFDDGNESDVTVALPALLERGLTATFFVLSGRLDGARSLSREQVRVLHDSGMAVGTHGHAHVSWRGLDARGRERELGTARATIEALVGRPVLDAALPLGRYDRAALTALRRGGYRSVHTSDRRWAHDGAWLQPRFSIRSTDTLDDVREILLPVPWPRRVRGEVVGWVKRVR